jgi:hypothetical protein
LPAWLLADLIVAMHVLWVAVVILTVPLVVFGAWRGWGWVRNPWFRHVHLAMIAVVVAESVLGITCPLTTWEKAARRAAGEEGYTGSFLGHWLHELLFFSGPPWVFTMVYVGFGLLVVGVYFGVRPRGKSQQP